MGMNIANIGLLRSDLYPWHESHLQLTQGAIFRIKLRINDASLKDKPAQSRENGLNGLLVPTCDRF
jgi:hypothetical protein